MKILHTADWHLGKKLYKQDLQEEQKLFLEWLLEHIEQEKIDILLVAGDIFDLANPPTEARALYYWFLSKLANKCQIVITGGNHDSAQMLDAPKELLDLLSIKVIGSARNSIEEELVVYQNVVIAAVPYLRDADIRKAVEGESRESTIENIRKGIKNHYEELATLCEEKYPNSLKIAMGHLYAAGAESSDSEREIQIGNLAGIDKKTFSETFSYVALGHIHRPQWVEKDRIRYSGSPIALSFSEREDKKIVVQLEIEEGKIQEIKEIEVPRFRKLKLIKGSMESVRKQLIDFQNDLALKAFIEIEVEESTYNPIYVQEINEIASVLDNDQLEQMMILKSKINFKNRILGSDQLFFDGKDIGEVSVTEMFEKKLETLNTLSAEDKELLMSAYLEIVQEIEQGK